MTSIMEGLKSIQQYAAAEEERKAKSQSKANWLVVPKNGKVELVVLQELDESSERYSAKNGLGVMALEHHGQGKDNFFKRYLCTNDEEHDFKCWACEKNRAEWERSSEENPYNGAWGVKRNLYLNVLVRGIDKDGEKYEEVAVMQRNMSSRSFVNQLIELAVEDGFISNRLFSLSRKGEGFDTVYTLTQRKEDAGVNVEDYEVTDLKSLLNDVPYERQAQSLGAAPSAGKAKVVDLSSETDPEDDDSDWL